MNNTTNRLETILSNAISTERRTADEYNATKISGGKECALCNALSKLGDTVYFLTDDSGVELNATNTWDATEREEKKVKNRVVISGHARGVFTCNAHSKNRLRYNLEGYCTENTYISGKDKPCKDGITTSFELETSDISDKGVTDLIVNHNAIPTSDSTVYIEVKVPIFHNLSGCTKLLGKIQSLIESGDLEINHTCGTHLHTGTIEGNINFKELFGSRQNIKNYIAFFEPLALHISRDYTDTEREALFGRTFETWAKRVYFGDNYCKCDGEYYGMDYSYGMSGCHVAMFNVQHSYSIEWRLPKYRNAEQYRKCIIAMQGVMIELKKAYYTQGRENITPQALHEAGIKAKNRFEKVFKG